MLRREMKKCQLCNWEKCSHFPGGVLPTAVAEIRGVRLCPNHLRLLLDIAASAAPVVEPYGVSPSEAVGYDIQQRKAS